MEHVEALPAFRQFLASVARLMPASVGNAGQLDAFLKQVGPLVAGPARRQWEAFQPELRVLRRWFTDCDLLERIVAIEDSYTEMVAWALRPATHPPSAELRQRNWLTSLRIDWRNAAPVEPRTQVWTEDGVPDLVLSFGTQTVVVEVKTGSAEHLVPSGEYQTVKYPAAVRSTLGLGSQHPVHMVFLTPDSRKAENLEAICTSFAQLALVLAKTLEEVELAGHLRFAFAMLITELATCSPSPVKQAVSWHGELTDELLVQRIGEISLTARLLLGGSNV